MKAICPECKNDIDLSQYGELKTDQIIECGMCGITLMAVDTTLEEITLEVVDEGK